jgi:hypothetical protein
MANKKISELPLINTLSGSNSGGTVIPIVVAGTTAQISAENFSKFVNAYNAHTGSAGNTFKGPQTIQSTLSVTGNTTIGGTLVVAGKLTAEEFHTEITSASVIYASGSTKFGDDTGDKHEFTGSINVSGSLIYNSVTLLNIDANTINRLQQATASLEQATSSLQAHSASVNAQLLAIQQTTQSLQVATASLQFHSASVNAQLLAIQQTTQSLQVATASLQAFSSSVNSQLERVYQTTQSLHVATASLQFHSASVDAQLLRLQQTTQSLQVATASLQEFSSSVNDQLQRVYQTTQSLHVATASIQLQTASLLAFTASQDSRNFTLSEVTASFNYFYQATASLQTFTASQADRNLILSTVTGSINQATASIQTQTASLLEFTASQDGRNLTLSTVTGSLIGITNGLMAFTAALDNTYATDAQLYQLYQATRSLELHSGSMVGVTNGLMEYTASLKGQAIVSSSTQIQNYDLFALNSNLYTSTGSIKGEIAGIEAYTSSLKAAISVSGTNVQIIGDLNVNKLNVQYISSSVLVTSGSNIFGDQSTDTHEFTGSVYLQNSLIIGTEVLGNAGLNAISASTRIELNSIEEYTASLKTAEIVSSSTQVQNYDVFGLNSNLYNSTGSLIGITNGLMALTASIKNSTIVSSSNQLGEIAGLQAYTSSLKSVAIVSSSQQIQNYNLFAVTSSANIFYGTQTISGSLLASGSSHTIQNGYVILQQVSQSLNFVDDTAAAAGGVPLGGLYRNGNFIVIRIV